MVVSTQEKLYLDRVVKWVCGQRAKAGNKGVDSYICVVDLRSSMKLCRYYFARKLEKNLTAQLAVP